MGDRKPITDEKAQVDHVARVLMAAWEKAEGKPVTPSYVATFADMARAVLADAPVESENPTPPASALPACPSCGNTDHYCGACGGQMNG